MNANVVSGVGREEQGPLPEDLMAHTVTETVYLGRASFRITHELEAVGTEEATADSSEWFSHDAAVILKGGPNGLAAREQALLAEDERGPDTVRPSRGFPRWGLLVALPAVAFGLGIAVASLAGSSAARRKAATTLPVAPAITAAPAPAVTPPVVPPVAIQPAPTPPAAAAVAVQPEAQPSPAPSAALPPSTVALAGLETAPPAAAPATAEARPAAAAVPRVIRPAAKPRVAKKAKPSKPADAEEADSGDDVPAATAATAPATAPKKPAVKWVDPWAN